MPLTEHNITGTLQDANGNPLQVGTVTFTPLASHAARVDGADVLLGFVVKDIKALPDPIALTEGPWRVVIATQAQQQAGASMRPAFDAISTTLDLTAAVTWGQIVSGAVEVGTITPTVLQQAADYAADAAASAAAAATWDPDTYVIHPKSKGAIGDGATNDTAALQAAIDDLAAFAVSDPPLSRPVVIDGQGGIYKITGSLDLTMLALGRGWEIRNLSIVAACAGKTALDFSGSRFGRLTNVRVWGDQTTQPHTGILLSKTLTDTCTHFLLDNVTVDGYFTSSALHVNAAEENNFRHCMFVNRRVADGGGEAWAAILDGAGFKVPASDFQTPSATRASFTVNKFDKCTIQKPFGIVGPTMFLQDLASISFESCYLTNGGGSGIVWRLTDGFTPYRVYMDFQIETTGVDNAIEFTSDAVTGVHEIRGLHCTFGNMFTDTEVFEVAASVTTLALRSFKAHVYRWASGVSLAGDLFSSPSKVTLQDADIVVPALTDFNDTANFALFDGKVVGMDGSQVDWQNYTPTLTNWALVDGTLTGELHKIGRTVHYRIRYTVGAGDTKSGNLVASLPFPAESGTAGSTPRGTAALFDTSASVRAHRFAVHQSSTSVRLEDAAGAIVTAAVPFTFAAGDVVDIAGTYEAAS